MPVTKIQGVNFITKHTLETAAMNEHEVVGVIVSRMIQAYGEAGGDLRHFDVAAIDSDESEIDHFEPGIELRLKGWSKE